MQKPLLAKYKGYIAFILFSVVLLLLCIYTLGSNQPALLISTANLKIDTRHSSVDDILGGITFRSTNSTGSRSSGTPSLYYSTPTAAYIESSILQEARESLSRLETKLQDVKNTASPGFSLARVFSVNDYLVIGTSAFKCYSDNPDADGIETWNSGLDTCATNGFLKCLGSSSKFYKKDSVAYQSINRNYLISMANLTNEEINSFILDYENVKNGAEPSSLRMNLPLSVYKKLNILSCNKSLSEKDQQKKNPFVNSSYAVGILGITFTTLALAIIVLGRIKFIVWLLSFLLFIGQFSLTLAIFTNVHKTINKETGGVRSVTLSGYIGFFCSILVFHIMIILIFIYHFVWVYQFNKFQPTFHRYVDRNTREVFWTRKDPITGMETKVLEYPHERMPKQTYDTHGWFGVGNGGNRFRVHSDGKIDESNDD